MLGYLNHKPQESLIKSNSGQGGEVTFNVSALAAYHLHGLVPLTIGESPWQGRGAGRWKEGSGVLGLVKAEWRGAGHQPCLHSHPPQPADEAERKGFTAHVLARPGQRGGHLGGPLPGPLIPRKRTRGVWVLWPYDTQTMTGL